MASTYGLSTSVQPIAAQVDTSIVSTVAAGAATLTVTSVPGQLLWIANLILSGSGANVANNVNVAITGLVNSMNFTVGLAAGAGTAFFQQISFSVPIPASAANTSIVITATPQGGTAAGNNVFNIAFQGFRTLI